MNLTPRQEQVVSLMATGMQNKEIARCMCISPRTVHAHLVRIYIKNKVQNRYGAIIKYLAHIGKQAS